MEARNWGVMEGPRISDKYCRTLGSCDEDTQSTVVREKTNLVSIVAADQGASKYLTLITLN